jgi:hypothetical protein
MACARPAAGDDGSVKMHAYLHPFSVGESRCLGGESTSEPESSDTIGILVPFTPRDCSERWSLSAAVRPNQHRCRTSSQRSRSRRRRVLLTIRVDNVGIDRRPTAVAEHPLGGTRERPRRQAGRGTVGLLEIVFREDEDATARSSPSSRPRERAGGRAGGRAEVVIGGVVVGDGENAMVISSVQRSHV